MRLQKEAVQAYNSGNKNEAEKYLHEITDASSDCYWKITKN